MPENKEVYPSPKKRKKMMSICHRGTGAKGPFEELVMAKARTI